MTLKQHTSKWYFKSYSNSTRRYSLSIKVHYYGFVLLISSVFFSAPTLSVEFCEMSTCTILGTPEADILVGSPQPDVICGLDGNDVLMGLAGDDLLCGGAGDDRVLGGAGVNVLYTGAGNDTVYAQGPDDTVFVGQGANTINLFYQSATVVDVSATNNTMPINSPADQEAASGAPGFTMAGNTIYAPDGEPFTVKGINIFPWHVSSRDVDGISDCWAFNTVRLHGWILAKQTSQWKDHVIYVDQPLIFDPSQTQYRTYNITPLIEAYTARGIVVIVDIHDMIGGYFEGEDLSLYLTFIEDFARRFQGNPYVWLDLHNEPGSWEGRLGDFTEWRDETLLALNTVRAVAPTMPLLVSGTAWGQDTGPRWNASLINPAESALLSNSDVINAYPGVIATFHMYDQWVFGQSRLTHFLDQLRAITEAPIVVGEYGSNNGNSTIEAARLLHQQVANPDYEQVGRIGWTWSAWDANDLVTTGDGSGFRIDDCSAPTNLTELGQLIWQDNHDL